MKKLLAAIVLAFAAFGVMAEESLPKNVAEFKVMFFEQIAAEGGNPDNCTVTLVDTGPNGHAIETACTHKPSMCLIYLHPYKDEGHVIACLPNPDYKPDLKV